jgi:hypothetical protein
MSSILAGSIDLSNLLELMSGLEIYMYWLAMTLTLRLNQQEDMSEKCGTLRVSPSGAPFQENHDIS